MISGTVHIHRYVGISVHTYLKQSVVLYGSIIIGVGVGVYTRQCYVHVLRSIKQYRYIMPYLVCSIYM